MEKKIQKKQKEINEAQFERAKRKAVYDTMTIIVEGQRDTVRELEKRSETMLRDYVESDNAVKLLLTDLSVLSDSIEQPEKTES